MILNKDNSKISAKEAARDIVAETLNANINNWKQTLENAGFELKIKEGSNEETKIEEQTEKLMERIFKTLKREFSPSDSEESEDEVTDEDLMNEEEEDDSEDEDVADELEDSDEESEDEEDSEEEEEIVKPSKKKVAPKKKAVVKKAVKKKVVAKKKGKK
jgi:hypothetical protein